MIYKSKSFDAQCISLGSENYLHLINLEKIDDKLKAHIDASIVQICEGKSSTDIPTIKTRLRGYLTPKKGTTLEMGAIAEFFSHLYLKDIGFKQKFLYINLEENSIKKGFDGLYSASNEEWIYESKSGNFTEDLCHSDKIKEGYNDIKAKLSGSVTNNPWQNAYNHAQHGDVSSSKKLKEHLKKLANDFTNGNFKDIKDFNLIPGSTIFMLGKWKAIDATHIETKVRKLITDFSYKKINVICMNKHSLDLFWNYLS